MCSHRCAAAGSGWCLCGVIIIIISYFSIIIITITIIITRFSYLEARCVCRQAAVKAAKILPLVGLARSKQDPINRGHGAQYLYRPPPAGASLRILSRKGGNSAVVRFWARYLGLFGEKDMVHLEVPRRPVVCALPCVGEQAWEGQVEWGGA
jgi:hypothetical protein